MPLSCFSSAFVMNGRSSRFPFTPSQWQELEHQALIFKYMASGIPIPPDLLFTLKRSSLDSPLSSTLFSHQPQHFGWNYLQMGLGRKIDLEPGRCRRTDGKKWRCSKEAYPDSKYCERHMHRGKNRSRKPVEVLKPTTATHTNPLTQTVSSITKNNPSHMTTTTHSNFVPYHPPSRPSATGLSFQDNTSAPLFLDSGSYTECRSRYVCGLKDEVDEHAFFTEPSGTTSRSFSASSMEDTWQFTPLTMSSSSSSSSKQRICSGLSNEYSYLQLQSLSDNSTNHKEQTQKTVHRFFDEWPHKSRDNLDDKSSTTQLSISIPTSSHNDFPAFDSRTQRDD